MAVQGNQIAQIEPIDPLYIHPFDNPAQPLFQISSLVRISIMGKGQPP